MHKAQRKMPMKFRQKKALDLEEKAHSNQTCYAIGDKGLIWKTGHIITSHATPSKFDPMPHQELY